VDLEAILSLLTSALGFIGLLWTIAHFHGRSKEEAAIREAKDAAGERHRFLWTWAAVGALAFVVGGSLYLSIRTAADQADLAQTTADAAVKTSDGTVAYLRGEQGIPGVPGSDGVEGTPGLPGTMGEQGERGPTGPRGPKGAKGDTGDAGPSGPAGPSGSEGSSGPTGASGEPGATGPDGSNGLDGVPGPAGVPGASGSPGPAGPSGAPGPTCPGGTTLQQITIPVSGTLILACVVLTATPAGAAG
jgi:hypothetical protein